MPLLIDKFEKWLLEYDNEFNHQARSPFYLVKSSEPCWKYREVTSVITFAASGTKSNKEEYKGFVKYLYMSMLPDRLKAFVEENHKNYFIDWSKLLSLFITLIIVSIVVHHWAIFI